VTLSPLQKRIVELSSKVIAAEDPADFAVAAEELRSALREQIAILRGMVHETKQNISKNRDSLRKTGTDL
jgi:hypothetical protein